MVGHRPPRLSEVAVEPLGDAALLIRFGQHIEPEFNRFVHALDDALRGARPPFVRDVVPAYASLAVHVEGDTLDQAERWVRERLGGMSSTRPIAAGRTVEIAVRYGGESGPDLADVATHCGLTPQAVVARHSGAEYRVAMIGFAAGFPYLLGLDPKLATPRLAQPRTRIAAGSVGIGGAQTGIYPQAGPGGWRIIGRTEAVLFDPQRDPPSLLQPGDRLRFVPIES